MEVFFHGATFLWSGVTMKLYNITSRLMCKSTKYKSTKSTIVQKYKKCKDVKNVKSIIKKTTVGNIGRVKTKVKLTRPPR